MTNTKFDPTKPVQTRDGRKARIVCVDVKTSSRFPYPILALITNPSGEESTAYFTDEGCASKRFDAEERLDSRDLINIPVKHKRVFWVNFYEDSLYIHSDAGAARRFSSPTLLATKRIEIEFEEGEGL